MTAVVAAWCLVIAGSAGYALLRGAPTAREQTTIAQALPTVDRAVADLVTAGGAAKVVPAVGRYVEADSSCRVTVARRGARYTRTVRFYTPEGAETSLLKQIGDRLPVGYRAYVTIGGADAPLRADAGNFVAVTGGPVGPGQIQVVIDTGCRPLAAPVVDVSDPVPPAANRAAVDEVLARLGVRDARQFTRTVKCASGLLLYTVEADGGPGSAQPSLGPVARQVPADAVVVDRPGVLAYRTGPVAVVVTDVDGALMVSATTGCGG